MKRHRIITFCLILLAAAGLALADDANNSTAGFDPSKSVQAMLNNNIFDLGRGLQQPIAVPPVVPKSAPETLTLVGTWSSAQGTFAIFDGSSPQYRKTFKPADTIAGYRIAEISHGFVKLSAGGKPTVNLPVGTQISIEQ